MKKKILSVLTVLLLTTMLVSPASARGNIKLAGGANNVEWNLGSLIAKATLIGLGSQDVTVVLDASGIPAITCTNNGGNDVPGQSSPKIFASGEQDLLGNSPIRKNGKSPFNVETDDPETIPWDVAGCPNSNWTGRIDFIFWTNAMITVKNLATGEVLLQQKYTCVTTRNPDTVSCTPAQ